MLYGLGLRSLGFNGTGPVLQGGLRRTPTVLGEKMGQRVLGGIAVLLVVTGELLSAGQVNRQAPALFRSSTLHVSLDVVVTDRADRPITDLTIADFEVREAGRRQVLDQFEAVRTPLGTRTVAIGTAFDSSPVSNSRPPPEARAFSFVVDEGTLLPEDIVPTKSVMRQFVRRLTSADRVSTTYIGRSDLSQDFTHDPARLDASIELFAAALGSGASTDSPSSPLKEGDDLATVMVLRNVVTALSSAPETRRAIVFVSRGTYPRVGRNRQIWQACYQEAERRGVPIYTIDPSGIAAPELGLQLSLEEQTPQKRNILDIRRRAAQNFLREVAENTGGRALVNKGTVLDSVDQIVTDNGSYYVIGFTPDREPVSGRFQDVDVRVSRPGAKVRSRRGYVLPSNTDALRSPKDLAKSLEQATPGGDLPMTADMAIIGRSQSGWDSIVTVEVTLPMSLDAPNSDDHLNVVWMALSPDGKVLSTQSHRFPVLAGTRVASIVQRFDLPQSARTFRVAVMSVSRQMVGRVHLSVPSIAGSMNAVSSLILGVDRQEGVSFALFGNPRQVLPFTPTTLRQVSTPHVLRLWCRLSNTVERVTLTVTGSDGRSQPLEIRQHRNPEAKAIDLTSDLEIRGLTPGHYTLRLAIVPSVGVEVLRTASFEVH